MDLYVLRHGKAERTAPGEDDAVRNLTEKGQRDARRLGRWMRDRDLAIDLVATSPYVRARETAVLVLQGDPAPPPIETWDELRPDGEVEAVLARLEAFDPSGAVLIVGHEPLLSSLASAAMGGGRIRLPRGALAKVAGFAPGGSGALELLVTPALIAPGP
ncbi:MAG: phosphohistidine phosphatase SixA [Methanospirillum sp.]|nr:phosphohistidine phosphatase SixA [Methanospirillum sp.]